MTSTPARPTWLKMPTDSPSSRTIFWLNTLDDEILRQVHNATSEPGELTNYFNPPAGWTPADADAILIAAPVIPEPPPPNATAVDLTRYGHELNFYTLKFNLYKEQRSALTYIKDQLISCMDPCTLQLIFPDRSTLLTMPSPQIYSRIWEHFSNPTQDLIDPIYADLAAPFAYVDTNSFDDHVAKFLKNQHALDNLMVPMGMNEKCTTFRKSLTNSTDSTIFQPYLVNYDVAHPSLARQSLTDMIAITRSALTQIAAQHAETHLSYLSNLATQPVRTRKSRPQKSFSPNPPEFCWTHGPGYHPSSRCKYPSHGHQAEATAANKMGSKH